MGDDERAFLAAIAAAPDDYAPHGVFADWLDEQGRHDEADYHRKWSVHVRAVERKLAAAQARIDELEAASGGDCFTCFG